MDNDLSILGGHNFDAQIKGLVNYCQCQKIICKLLLLIEMKTCRDVFIIFLFLMFILTLSAANIGISMDSSS